MLFCRKTAMHIYWKICCFVYVEQVNVYSFTACFYLVLSHVIMEDFDIKMEHCAVIRFFVWKDKSLKETIDELYYVYRRWIIASAYHLSVSKCLLGREAKFHLEKSSRQSVSQITQVNVIKNQFSIMIDWSVFKNRFFNPIIDFRSYMIDLFIFVWLIFRFFFWQWKKINFMALGSP